MVEGINQGVIAAVCSDHQPHDADAKSAPFSLTEPGASTIELLLPLMSHLANRKEITFLKAISLLTYQPANILGIDKGTLGIGKDADICILDPNMHQSVHKEQLLSAGKNSPYKGWELQGLVTHTLFNGEVVYTRD